MKRSFPNIVSALIFLFAVESQAQVKNASLVANCRSLSLGKFSGYMPSVGNVDNYVTTYDGTSGFPQYQNVNGLAYYSRELRPRAGQSGVYEADYVTDDSSQYIQYGSFTMNLPTTDSDGNGLPDISQKNKFVSAAISGSGFADWSLNGVTGPFYIAGNISRAANSQTGNYSVTVTTPSTGSSVDYSGTWFVLYVSGSVSYQRGYPNTFNFNLTYTDPFSGTSIGLTGSTSFTVNSANQIAFPQFSLTGSDNKTYTINAASTLNRVGNKYIGNWALVDGGQITSWPDYTGWVVEIIDTNDSNGDGIPDLSDPFAIAPASPTALTAVAGSSSIALAWQDNANNEQGFRVERKIGAGGAWSFYTTVGSNVTSYNDTGVVAGNTYYYRVYAYNAIGPSASYSNEAFAALQSVPSSPTSLSAVGGSSSIALAWQDNANNEQGFYIERKIGVGGTWAFYTTVGPNAAFYNDNGVVAGNTYYYRVYAYNATGNSVYYSNEAFAALTGPLTLTINGSGTVSPNLNGQNLEIGKSYTMTATPGTGYIFSNWTGGIVVGTPILTFTMQTNLTLQANFVPNPFAPTKGTYSGLFYETNGVRHGSSGFFTAKTTEGGAFSSTVLLAGQRYSSSGQFTAEGKATNTILRLGANPLTVGLQLDFTGTDQLRGTISDGVWVADLLANRSVFNVTTNPYPFVGKYTLIIPGSTNGATSPAGDGFGTLTVDGNGLISLKGALADGTKLAQKKVTLSKHGEWPLYATLNGGQGSILGWITFTNRVADSLNGTGSWIKAGGALTAIYPGGFTNLPMIHGSIYDLPAGGKVLNFTAGRVVLSGGNLTQNWTNTVTLGNDNKVENTSSNALTIKLKSKTGLFKGSFIEPGTGRKVSFSGALQQKLNVGLGYFLGTTESGEVRFEAQ